MVCIAFFSPGFRTSFNSSASTIGARDCTIIAQKLKTTVFTSSVGKLLDEKKFT